MIELDLLADGSAYLYTESVNLSDRLYRLTLKYNARLEVWTITVTTESGETIVAGQPITLFADLLGYSVSPNRPPGALVAIPRTALVETPGLRDLGPGARVGLYYVEPS